MTIYYSDYINGNDANSGADWANAWKTLSKVTGPAGGDVIRIAKSPDPTSLGTGTWTSTPDSAAGQTWPPTAKTITTGGITTAGTVNLTAHGWATGDVIWISGHTNNTRANGVWSITFINANSFSLDGFPSVFSTSGTATGGSTTTLIDTGRNFRVDGVVIGDTVTKTLGGTTSVVTGISTTTNPHDTLNFAVMGAFVVGAAYSIAQTVGSANGSAYNINYRVVKLSDAPVLLLEGCDDKNDWNTTAITNVTVANDANIYKSGLRSTTFALATAFTTGKIAYKYLSSTNIDLSAYKQISFWLRFDNPTSLAPWAITGTALTGSSAVKLVDTAGRNFVTLGVTVGSQVMRTTGTAPYTNASSLVTSISTTSSANDTLNFAALPGEQVFANTNTFAVFPLSLRIKLCSDTTGDTAVDDLLVTTPIPTGALQWIPIVINKGSALGSTIKSISIWTDLDPSTTAITTMWIDNIMVCKDATAADSLTHQSLVGKNTSDEPAWYGIGAVVDGTSNGAVSATGTFAGTPQGTPGSVRKFLILDNATSSDGSVGGTRGYSGVTESVTTYKRDTIATILCGDTSSSNAGGLGASGTASGYLEYQGGYNTGSSVQDGETYFDGLCGYGIGLTATGASRTYVKVNKIYLHRYASGFACGNFNYFQEIGTGNNGNVSNSGGGLSMNSNNYFEDVKYINNNGPAPTNSFQSGFLHHSGNTGNFGRRIRSISNNSSSNGINNGAVTFGSASYNTYWIDNIKNNACKAVCYIAGSNFAGNNILRNFTSSLNTGSGAGASGTISYQGVGANYLDHVQIKETLATVASIAGDSGFNQRIVFHNYQKTANSHRHVMENGEIWAGVDPVTITGTATGGSTTTLVDTAKNFVVQGVIVGATVTRTLGGTSTVTSISQTTNPNDTLNFAALSGGNSFAAGNAYTISGTGQVHTPGGVSWRFSPTTGTDPGGRHQFYPLKLPLAKIAVAANKLVTVSAYVRRDSTNMMMQLICRSGQLSGITAPLTASITAAVNTWQQLTITFTPTEIGVVEIEAWGYSLVTGAVSINGWIDDMTVSQAG